MKIRALCCILTATLIPGCSKGVSDSRLSEDWIYPGAIVLESGPTDGIKNGSRALYSSSDDAEKIQIHYLERILAKGWNITQVTTAGPPDTEFYQCSVLVFTPERSEVLILLITQSGPDDSSILLTLMPYAEMLKKKPSVGMRAFVDGNAKRGDEVVQLRDEDRKARRPDYTAEIKQYINDGSFAALYDLGSDGFERRRSPDLFADSLSGLKVERFQLRQMNQYGDFCLQIIDYETTRGARVDRGLCIMFWTKKQGKWGYENFPLGTFGPDYPENLRRAFD